jgi:phage FluMu protein Com
MAGSHHTYIPWFQDDQKEEDTREWQAEALEMMKTQRLCVKCGQFHHYQFAKKETYYIHLSCPSCHEVIKLPRKRNRMETKWAKAKWK